MKAYKMSFVPRAPIEDYLFYERGFSKPKKTPQACPGCGGAWKLEAGKTLVNYKCEVCRLVADEACGV